MVEANQITYEEVYEFQLDMAHSYDTSERGSIEKYVYLLASLTAATFILERYYDDYEYRHLITGVLAYSFWNNGR